MLRQTLGSKMANNKADVAAALHRKGNTADYQKHRVCVPK
jgi:hypothetical protein